MQCFDLIDQGTKHMSLIQHHSLYGPCCMVISTWLLHYNQGRFISGNSKSTVINILLLHVAMAEDVPVTEGLVTLRKNLPFKQTHLCRIFLENKIESLPSKF